MRLLLPMIFLLASVACEKGSSDVDLDTDAERVPGWTYRQPALIDTGTTILLMWDTDVCVGGTCVPDLLGLEVWPANGIDAVILQPDWVVGEPGHWEGTVSGDGLAMFGWDYCEDDYFAYWWEAAGAVGAGDAPGDTVTLAWNVQIFDEDGRSILSTTEELVVDYPRCPQDAGASAP
jgi:hypothetical protein